MTFDKIIRQGYVVDGSGKPGGTADIGIRHDRIAAIGDLGTATAEQEIDAQGKIVCPGFIDVHVHSELTLLGGIDQYAPLKMGVTTQLASPDGFAWAPMSRERLLEQRAYLQVFYDDEMIDTTEDMSIDRWLAMYENRLPSNLALQIPHGSIRTEVVGWEDRVATDEEIGRMENMVQEWIDRGARAFCTGLEYESMRRADLRELVRLSRIAARHGGVYVAHQRGYAEKVRIGCGETFAIAEQAEIPVHISHFTVDEQSAEQIEEARARDIAVTFDMYPYPAGCTHLLLGLPAELQLGSPAQVMARFRQPGLPAAYSEALAQAFAPERLRFAAVGTEEPMGWEGRSLAEVAEELGLGIPEAICEIMNRTKMQSLMIYHWPEERFRYLEPTFKHPLHMVSTDGIYVGERPHPRGYGTYPRVLREYVRDKRWLTLEQAIYKMCGFPAQTFKIRHRGLLAEQYYADIVIFDADRVADQATFTEPRQDPIGIDYVMVNGKIVVGQGHVHQGMHGRILSE